MNGIPVSMEQGDAGTANTFGEHAIDRLAHGRVVQPLDLAAVSGQPPANPNHHLGQWSRPLDVQRKEIGPPLVTDVQQILESGSNEVGRGRAAP